MERDGDVTHRLIHRADSMTREAVRGEGRVASIIDYLGREPSHPLFPVPEPAVSFDLLTSSVHRIPYPVDESARAAVEWRA